MQPMRLFIDTHDRKLKTFPDKLTPEEFEGFYALYEKACYAEGVVPVRLHVGYEDGRAFCLNMAPDAEAVKRAHDRVGLPFDSITEVKTATPGDTFFHRPAA
jgi:Nickel responsive protein SCO4226-like